MAATRCSIVDPETSATTFLTAPYLSVNIFVLVTRRSHVEIIFFLSCMLNEYAPQSVVGNNRPLPSISLFVKHLGYERAGHGIRHTYEAALLVLRGNSEMSCWTRAIVDLHEVGLLPQVVELLLCRQALKREASGNHHVPHAVIANLRRGKKYFGICDSSGRILGRVGDQVDDDRRIIVCCPLAVAQTRRGINATIPCSSTEGLARRLVFLLSNKELGSPDDLVATRADSHGIYSTEVDEGSLWIGGGIRSVSSLTLSPIRIAASLRTSYPAANRMATKGRLNMSDPPALTGTTANGSSAGPTSTVRTPISPKTRTFSFRFVSGRTMSTPTFPALAP